MTSYCLQCGELVRSGTPILHSGVFLTKSCKKCGVSMVLIETDPEFFEQQERLPRTFSQNDCYMLDITGKCDARCKHCYNRGGEHREIDEIAAEMEALPPYSRVLLSGGEPLEHPEIYRIVRMASRKGLQPVLLTNGARLTPDVLNALIISGLSVKNGWPQVAVSLQTPGFNNTHEEAFKNLQNIKVADIAFTVEALSDIPLILDLARQLKNRSDAFCLRVAWDGVTEGPYVSEIVKALNGTLMDGATLHGYRNAEVVKNGQTFKVLSWPTKAAFDVERYTNRGVWYRGKNVVETLINEIPLP